MAADHRLTEEDRALLEELRQHSIVNRRDGRLLPPRGPRTRGERIADSVTAALGTWPFILTLTAFLAIWVLANVPLGEDAWDPYPFIFLNLVVSFLGAYTAPIIMMSQNRQTDLDRERMENDYRINVKSELEIQLLHQKVDHLIAYLEAKPGEARH